MDTIAVSGELRSENSEQELKPYNSLILKELNLINPKELKNSKFKTQNSK